MGSVEIDVVNKNLFNEQYVQGYFADDSGNTNTATNGARADDYIPVGDNKIIYVLFKCLKSCTLARFWLMEFDENYNGIKRTTAGIYDTSFNIGNTIKQLNLSQNCRYIKPSFYSLRDGGTALTYDKFNEYFDISISKNQTEEHIEHQSQTVIMPIQQEMLEGDYVADVEHHEWGKIILTGEEKLIDNVSTSIRTYWGIDFSNYGIYQYNDPTKICDVLTTKFKSRPQQGTFLPGQVALITSNKNMYFVFEPDTTEEQARAILKDMPVYFRLATPFDLELTSEQKAVREQKMYTYKNITNISLSDELASIDVEYKKDIETEHNKLQNEIDEIKQLISTTETSALLLDNLQKDVESEVE